MTLKVRLLDGARVVAETATELKGNSEVALKLAPTLTAALRPGTYTLAVMLNSAQETEFQCTVLCFLVTSMIAMVAPEETAPTRSFTSSCRMSFSALRTAGAGLVSSSSETISILLPRTPPLAFSSSTASVIPIV